MKKLITGVIILGVIGLSLNILFGGNAVVYLYQENNNGIIWYRYDLWAYLENLKNSFTDVSKLTLTIPNLEMNNDIAHNLKVIANILIVGINVLIYPFRIVFYGIKILLSILGLPTLQGTYDNNPMYWLIELANNMVDTQIPTLSY